MTARCRCIRWEDNLPCCRERGKSTLGSDLDAYVRAAGCYALANFDGSRVFFYPIGRLPQYVAACFIKLENLTALRDFLITQARVGPIS